MRSVVSRPRFAFVVWVSVSCLALSTAAARRARAEPPRYEVRLLAAVPSFDVAIPFGLNEEGVVVGYAAPEPFHPEAKGVRGDAASGLSIVETPNENGNFLHSLDESGRIVGESGGVAILWENGRAEPLLVPEGFFSGAARDINNSGLICGSYGDSDFVGPQHCVWPSPGERAVVLQGIFPENTTGSAWEINEFGQIAGVSGSVSGVFFAVRWDSPDEAPIQIGPLLGAMNSEGLGLNERGDVVGRSSFADFTTEAFFFDGETEELVPLGFLDGGGSYSEALDVNDARQIVGTARAPGGGVHAVIWDEGEIYDLNALAIALDPSIRYLASARAINGEGEIAVEAVVEGDDESTGVFRRRIALLKPTSTLFRRGDANDDGGVDIADPIRTLGWLFTGGSAPGCIAAANSNGDGGVNIADAVFTLGFLFLGGPSPGNPFPDCGPPALPADVELGCETRPAGCR